jgi:hypothetical protein
MKTRLLLLVFTLSVVLVHHAYGEDSDWKEEFNKTYRLEEKEVLKRIAPPFIPERLDYYQHEFSSQAKKIEKPPTYFKFKWRGEKLLNDGYGFIGKKGLNLSNVLRSVLKLSYSEFEGDRSLLDIELPGDWIIREDATIEQKLQALADILQQATGKTIAFTQQQLERNVIVVTGNYTAETRDDNRNLIDIHCYSTEKDPDEGSGGGSGTMEEFITRLGDLIGFATSIETPSRPIGTMSWRTHSSSYVHREPAGAERDEKINQLLGNIAQQTGLELKIEQRQVPVWVVTEASEK